MISDAGSVTLKSIKVSDRSFNKVRPPHRADEFSLVFASTADQFQQAVNASAAGIITLNKISGLVATKDSYSLWATSNIQQSMSLVLPLFDEKQNYRPVDIHPTAIVHPKAKLSSTCKIGAYSIIEEGVEIGDYCILNHHIVVQAYSKVGARTQIQPFSIIGAFCEVGESCIISPHVTIGSDGFGFFTERLPLGQVKHHKIPQIGKVVIEDFCELGAHCSIDRATLSETRIGKGSKLDNFCHIAHNCEFGENAMMAAGFMTAGSTKVGKNFLAAGHVDLNGHIEITDNVVLTARSGVISSIEKPGVYGGFPIEPHKENLRTMASLQHLKDIRRQVQKLLRHLNLNNEGDSQ